MRAANYTCAKLTRMDKLRYIALLLAVAGLGYFAYLRYGTIKEKMPCEEYRTGDLSVSNKTTKPYNVFVGGNLRGTVESNDNLFLTDLSAGVHSFKAIQASGYFLSPDVTSGSVDIIQCQTKLVEVIR